jgi:hypothetical protein
MGCDIHAYIEMYNNSSDPFVDCFAENISIGRDYKLFGLLAGVRSHNTANATPKGIPTSPGLSYMCGHHYYLNVCDMHNQPNTHSNPICFHGRRCISTEDAHKVVTEGRAKYVDAQKTIITDPDWHSATYLCLAEMMQVRKQYLLDNVMYESELSGKKRKALVDFIEAKDPRTLMQYAFPEHDSLALYASIKTMMALESGSGENEIKTRFVCWFDS